jgi:hypothetical protein
MPAWLGLSPFARETKNEEARIALRVA